MVHLKSSVLVLALALAVAVASEISKEKSLVPVMDKTNAAPPHGHAEPPDGGPPTPPSHNEGRPPGHGDDRPPSGPPLHPPSGPPHRPPSHGPCSGSRPQHCYQTDYCSRYCYSNNSACYAGGLGDYYCNQYCKHTYGNRWYGRDEGCYCYCYRRD